MLKGSIGSIALASTAACLIVFSAVPQPMPDSGKLDNAHEDIMRMGEIELRSLVEVLVECRFSIGQTSEDRCAPALEKYRIEYERDRTIDEVLTFLQLTSSAARGLSVATIDHAPKSARDISLDDIREVMRQADKTEPIQTSPIQLTTALESKLRTWAHDRFRKMRGE